ncbi:Abi family protein [Actinotignum sp. GS-2025b]|uniref:Abi family protein n=1 Tax=Actinotignum sp. GS-2025b TaxID=3427275 RepID=UPI003F4507FE
MTQATKVFKTHGDQIALLCSRGMRIDDPAYARFVLERVNYYRLSGYWYSFRQPSDKKNQRLDDFVPGTSFHDVVEVYNFDERLRSAVFSCLTTIELALRSMLGHELGRIDPLIHLHPELLGPLAHQKNSRTAPSGQYLAWRARYDKELSGSREDFVEHHRRKYGGELPIWAGVEIMGWGLLTHLYELSPITVRNLIAARAGLTLVQFTSWIKTLNIMRNYSAHHARVFNRVFTLKPRFPKVGVHPELDVVRAAASRCFGQLTLIQYLLGVLNIGDRDLLPAVLATYPDVVTVPISHMGAPNKWQELTLWRQ